MVFPLEIHNLIQTYSLNKALILQSRDSRSRSVKRYIRDYLGARLPYHIDSAFREPIEVYELPWLQNRLNKPAKSCG